LKKKRFCFFYLEKRFDCKIYDYLCTVYLVKHHFKAGYIRRNKWGAEYQNITAKCLFRFATDYKGFFKRFKGLLLLEKSRIEFLEVPLTE
jgi:hypothetical protein